jgi:hypothetical protein
VLTQNHLRVWPSVGEGDGLCLSVTVTVPSVVGLGVDHLLVSGVVSGSVSDSVAVVRGGSVVTVVGGGVMSGMQPFGSAQYTVKVPFCPLPHKSSASGHTLVHFSSSTSTKLPKITSEHLQTDISIIDSTPIRESQPVKANFVGCLVCTTPVLRKFTGRPQNSTQTDGVFSGM